MASKNNAKLYDPSLLIQAGINPKTGLPIKMGGSPCALKEDVRKILRIIDEQDAINRFKWYNLPDGLDGQLLERILYYRGQGAFFYMEAEDFSENDTLLWFDVSGFINGDDEIYSIASSGYSEFLLYNISEETLEKFSYETILAHCFYEVTFYGFEDFSSN